MVDWTQDYRQFFRRVGKCVLSTVCYARQFQYGSPWVTGCFYNSWFSPGCLVTPGILPDPNKEATAHEATHHAPRLPLNMENSVLPTSFRNSLSHKGILSRGHHFTLLSEMEWNAHVRLSVLKSWLLWLTHRRNFIFGFFMLPDQSRGVMGMQSQNPLRTMQRQHANIS